MPGRQLIPVRKPPAAAQADATEARPGLRQPLIDQARSAEDNAAGARFLGAFSPSNELEAHYSQLAVAHQRLADFLLQQAQALGATNAQPRSNLDVIRGMAGAP